MRFACLVLVFLPILAKVYPAEDIYWEGEDVSNEFLEVEPEDSSITRHLQRLKRNLFGLNWDPFGIGSTTTETPEVDERLTWGDNEAPEEDEKYGEYDSGSGSPDKEPEKEKTLHVTFVVSQPYQESYSNRDSPEFQNFSRSLAGAVDSVFEKLPGTHRASLVRIQSRPTDEFTCKVTLDIVTNGDTARIDKILHDYITQKRSLGGFAVHDEDYNSTSDPSAQLSTCSQYEIRCSDGRCLPASALCNRINDCSDGGDEMNCPSEIDDDDDSFNQEKSDDYTTDDSESDCQEICNESHVTINCNQRCDNIVDCPLGDDELGCEVVTTSTAAPTSPETPEVPATTSNDPLPLPPVVTTSTAAPTSPEMPEVPATTSNDPLPLPPVECGSDELRCDDQRCVHVSSRCNRIRDCDDGTDEDNCDFEEPETTPAPIIPVTPPIDEPGSDDEE